jgi:hypothetical protein
MNLGEKKAKDKFPLLFAIDSFQKKCLINKFAH